MSHAPCIGPRVDFRRNGGVDPGYRGERVVPFEVGGRRLTPAERNELTPSTAPTQRHGSLKGLLIQDRRDAVAASEREGQAVHHATFWAARDWAQSVGFEGRDIYVAAAAALTLRREHGAGNVTRAMVADQMRCAAGDPHQDSELVAAWEAVQRELAQAVGESTYRIWLAPVHPHAQADGEWIVGCPANIVSWVDTRFGRVLESCAARPVTIVACEGRAA